MNSFLVDNDGHKATSSHFLILNSSLAVDILLNSSSRYATHQQIVEGCYGVMKEPLALRSLAQPPAELAELVLTSRTKVQELSKTDCSWIEEMLWGNCLQEGGRNGEWSDTSVGMLEEANS